VEVDLGVTADQDRRLARVAGLEQALDGAPEPSAGLPPPGIAGIRPEPDG